MHPATVATQRDRVLLHLFTISMVRGLGLGLGLTLTLNLTMNYVRQDPRRATRVHGAPTVRGLPPVRAHICTSIHLSCYLSAVYLRATTIHAQGELPCAIPTELPRAIYHVHE